MCIIPLKKSNLGSSTPRRQCRNTLNSPSPWIHQICICLYRSVALELSANSAASIHQNMEKPHRECWELGTWVQRELTLDDANCSEEGEWWGDPEQIQRPWGTGEKKTKTKKTTVSKSNMKDPALGPDPQQGSGWNSLWVEAAGGHHNLCFISTVTAWTGAEYGHPGQPAASLSPLLNPYQPQRGTLQDTWSVLTIAPASPPRWHRCKAPQRTPGPHHFGSKQLTGGMEHPRISWLFMQFNFSWPPGCPQQSLELTQPRHTSVWAVLPGCPLSGEPQDPTVGTHFSLSYPAEMPSAQRALGLPQLMHISALAIPPGQP